MSVLVGAGVGPQVNKLEQVSSDDHQMPLARGYGWVCPGDPLPCPMMHVMLPTPSGQNDGQTFINAISAISVVGGNKCVHKIHSFIILEMNYLEMPEFSPSSYTNGP